MAAALTIFSWFACILALASTVTMGMAIKFQEERESKRALANVNIAEGESYLRRYRFLFGAMPMAFFLLVLAAIPTFSCEIDGSCGPYDERSGLFVISLTVGLFAWSLCGSLLYNRYFHSQSARPFRFLVGAERWMLVGVKVLAVAALALSVWSALSV